MQTFYEVFVVLKKFFAKEATAYLGPKNIYDGAFVKTVNSLEMSDSLLNIPLGRRSSP